MTINLKKLRELCSTEKPLGHAERQALDTLPELLDALQEALELAQGMEHRDHCPASAVRDRDCACDADAYNTRAAAFRARFSEEGTP